MGLPTFRHDTLVNAAGSAYMRRWVLTWSGGTLRVHHILGSDDARAWHDHPWDFTTLLLWGSYVEHRPGPDPLDPEVGRSATRYTAGSVLRRRAEDLHRLSLDAPVWTLVRTGPRLRSWGFLTRAGEWVPWRRYEALMGVNGINHQRGATT
jgi:hypothetical protein